MQNIKRIPVRQLTINKADSSTNKPANEQLAILYQQGNIATLSALWRQNTGLLHRLSYHYYTRNQALCTRCGVTPDDLQQESFFALEMAATAYDPDKGFKFTTYLHHHIQNVCNELCGMRTNHGRTEPLSRASSLNEPAGGEGTESGELIPDPDSSYDFDRVDDRLFLEQLQEATGAALSRLDEQQREVIHYRYYEGKTIQQTAEAAGLDSVSEARSLEAKALRSMRCGDSLRELWPFMPYMHSWAYQETGFTPWKHKGSVQERIIERLEDMTERRRYP